MSPQPSRSPIDRRTFTPQPDGGLPSRPPIPDPRRLGHSLPYGEQPTVQLGQNQLQIEPQPEPKPVTPYEFITDPPPPPPRHLLPGGDSKAVRAAYIVGGLVILLILFSIIRGLLSNDGNFAPFTTIAQDQQEMIYLTTSPTHIKQERNLTTVNRNFTATATVSLRSAQTEVITYLATNKQKKLQPKVLNLKISASTNKRLQEATAATNYNQVFKEIMEARLKSYQRDLDQAYQQVEGKNGRALLKKNYEQAELLLKQLNAPDT